MQLIIAVEDPSGADIARFLAAHVAELREISPPGSSHALDLEGLRGPGITFWTARDGDRLIGCGALKQLDPSHAEIKSMRTGQPYLGRGVASGLVTRILQTAQDLGFSRVSLETGSSAAFAPARRLYERFGFTYCPPFADYPDDPHSVHMTKLIAPYDPASDSSVRA